MAEDTTAAIQTYATMIVDTFTTIYSRLERVSSVESRHKTAIELTKLAVESLTSMAKAKGETDPSVIASLLSGSLLKH